MIEANWVGKTPEEYYEILGFDYNNYEEGDEDEGEEE